MRAVHRNEAESGLAAAGPALLAACAFASVSVFGKVSFAHGGDIATFLVTRGVVGIAIIWIWLKGVPRARAFTRRETAVALGLGLLYAANVYTLFRAIEVMSVPLVSLTYFLYPVITGVVGAFARLDVLGPRGAAAAVAAFAGLAMMIGAEPAQLVWSGLAFATAAAGFRATMLLVTRAALPVSDPRDVSWYTMLGSTAVFAALLAAQGGVRFPSAAAGWAALLWASVAAAVAVIAMFASARRVGPFRTALFMNAEPVATILLAAIVLGEGLAPSQWAGAAVMIGALFWFQKRR